MPYYVVANYDITDEDALQTYNAAARPTLGAAGARPLVLDVAGDDWEGSTGDRLVVLEFASREAARAWYESEEYQQAIPLRHAASANGWVRGAEGFVPPS